MKDLLRKFNRTFENRSRLAIMSVLMVNDGIEFTALKRQLNMTDGNLATHIASLEREKYVSVRKEFVKRKPQTTYAATAAGRKAFAEHLNALEEFIRTMT